MESPLSFLHKAAIVPIIAVVMLVAFVMGAAALLLRD
jgi:hypothetical protein